MKTMKRALITAGLFMLAIAPALRAADTAVSTAFTYQGRLAMAGSPVTGAYDLRFTLYNAATGGSVVGTAVTKLATPVSGGMFSVTLDFGWAPFAGSARWLEIAVKPKGSSLYTILSPRQPITQTPYAIRAMAAPWSGISGNKFAGSGSATTVAHSDHNHWGHEWRGKDTGMTLATTASTYTNPVTFMARTNAPHGNAISGIVSDGMYGFMQKQTGVAGLNYGSEDGGYGVYGYASAPNGRGTSGRATGLNSVGVNGESTGSHGVGVAGEATNVGGIGVEATGNDFGVKAAANAYALYGSSPAAAGTGVYGMANGGTAAYGIWGVSSVGYAGYFSGKVHVSGALSKSSGSFKIDHPLEPAKKYLSHSFVESPDMMNIYNGNVVLDAKGEAVVTLPEWFEALNKEFRYQLTCVGGFAPVYVAEKISKNRFRIGGGREGLEVSWQVTGVRKDAWARDNRIQVEEVKPADEQGTYMYPEGFGQKSTLSLDAARLNKMKSAASEK